MSKTNKNSATEDQLGEIHDLVTRVYSKRLGKMVDILENEEGETSLEDIMSLDMKTVQAAAKWVESNGIGAKTADTDEESQLAKDLKKIQERHGNKIAHIREV